MADQPSLNSSSIILAYLVDIKVIIIVQVYSEEGIKKEISARCKNSIVYSKEKKMPRR